MLLDRQMRGAVWDAEAKVWTVTVSDGSGGAHVLTARHLISSAPIAELAPAARLAQRFANSYARSVYRRRPPRLPGATRALTAQLRQAASRVPPVRRRLRPREVAVDLVPLRPTTLRGSVEIADGRFPVFTVGFTLKKGAAGWRVVSASPPG